MNEIVELKLKANKLRRKVIDMSFLCGRAAHPGPALSIIEIITALYFKYLRYDVNNPDWELRDRFVLSKGHACPALYAALCEAGFFGDEHFSSLRHVNGVLQGHPSVRSTPGVDITSGSLGNGLGLGVGMAYYQKIHGYDNSVYVILGDGEMNEGTVWEAVMEAPILGLDRLTAVVDKNLYQSCDSCANILPMNNMICNWESFGWNVLEIDGNDMGSVVNALHLTMSFRGKPSVIIANTIKGKGVSFMENNNAWHQKVLSENEYTTALLELQKEAENLCA
jgi:transketolase